MVTHFQDSFKCSLLPVEEYSCFELQLVKLVLMLFIVFIYRPPNFDKVFIQDFSDIFSFNVLTSDNLNIHVCCPSNPLVNQFSELVDSF